MPHGTDKVQVTSPERLGRVRRICWWSEIWRPDERTKHVVRSEGGVRGLFKGLVPILAREVPGNAAMFGVYEGIKQYFAGGANTSDLGRGSLIVAGGLAGATFWASVYPADVVKSVIQVDNFKNPKLLRFH